MKDQQDQYQQNAWPEFIHYRKYKNNEKTVDLNRRGAGPTKQRGGDTGEDDLIIRWSSCWSARPRVCVCVGCVSFRVFYQLLYSWPR